MKRDFLWLLAGVAIGVLLTVPLAHAEVHRLDDCAVFPPAPVRVIHRPHHFAHHYHPAPVCHCGDAGLGGPAGDVPRGDDGAWLNNGDDNALGDSFTAGLGPVVGGGAGGLWPVGLRRDYAFRVADYGGGGNPVSPVDLVVSSIPVNPVLVPEPSTLALMALGAGALALSYRGRRA